MAELAYLQVSRVCNQKCVFCSNPDNGKIISWESATSLIDSFAAGGAPGVILTGGEPTLFPRLDELVAYAVAKGLPPRLITNGQRTSDLGYLRSLFTAGLAQMHVSVHSHKPEVQAAVSQNRRSLDGVRRTLRNAAELGLRIDVNTVINTSNADHLSGLVRWVAQHAPHVEHFVWNNLDPLLNRASLNPSIIPRLRDFEVELHKAMTWLAETGRTFRVERVPLCFMSDFPHSSTETRKIIKDEQRRIYFLDDKGLKEQNQSSWHYGKSERCSGCSVNGICAGLYQMDVYYSSDELCPLFVDAGEVSRRVLENI